jgi:hypothetical protein
MGYVIALSPCYGCGQLFTYNPVRVPSVIVRGSREPICERCLEAANPQRIARGLEPMVLFPGAYDACDEGEL